MKIEQIGGIIIAICCIFLAIRSINKQFDKETLLSKWGRSTHGEVVKKNSNGIMLEYFVEGKNYETILSSPLDCVIGERFMIKYYIANPNICEVLVTKPVFLENEIVDTTFGNIIRIETKNKELVFYYFVDTLKLYKTIKYSIKDTQNIRYNKNYNVIYSPKTPQRAIINIK